MSSFNSSEVIPYVVGSLITLALIKWLFSKVDDRPVNSPSLYFSYSPDPDSVREIQNMFPNIPRAYIVRELDRADGVVAVAIDRLLLLAPDFANHREGDESVESTSPVIQSTSTTHYNILKSLKEGETVMEPSETLTKKNWDSIDSKTRQRILTDKKKEMLLKAREAFLSKK